MDLFFERHYRHPIDKVWKAITSSDALERWLMSNDFKPKVGANCVFRFCAEDSTEDSRVLVTVEELRRPEFMRWRWRNEGEEHDTVVTFELEETDDGTTLRLRHRGTPSKALAAGLKKGWPTKLDDLGRTLAP